MRAHTRPLDADVDLNDIARGDGYLFVRDGVGIAGRGVAARVPLADVPAVLAAMDHLDEVGGVHPIALGSVPFEPGADSSLVIPAVQTTYGSFLGPDGKENVGLANYEWIFGTPDNWVFLRNTAIWIIITPIFSTVVGLVRALLVDRMRRESIPKSLIFMPMAISFVGASIIWGLVYEYRDPADEL